MFDAHLSCFWFCLPVEGRHSPVHVELAKSWTDEQSIDRHDDGVLRWSRSTALRIGDTEWYEDIDLIEFRAAQAIVPLGRLSQGDLRGYAFVSPFTSATKSFRRSVDRFLQREVGEQPRDVRPNLGAGLHMDLKSFVSSMLHERPEVIGGLKGLTASGLRYDVRPNPPTAWTDVDHGAYVDDTLEAVSVNTEDVRAVISSDCTIGLEDAGMSIQRVASSLTALFVLTQGFVTQSNDHRRTIDTSY